MVWTRAAHGSCARRKNLPYQVRSFEGAIIMNTLEGKVTLITGVKGGLGTFITEAFLAAGAKVVGVSRSIQASDFPHPGTAAMPAELSSGEAARKVADDIVGRLGRIDILVHRRQGGGRVLAVASRQAVEPGAMVGAYSASKAALVALIRTIALENTDRGISANTVLPGTMDTPSNRAADPKADPLQWVQPAQVAALLVHLVSDAGAQVTGAAIPIYGRQV
jgi:NAD(P)-dependent dehydrogenase (short-subunit alcohol dehydrogenase family)